MGEDDDDGDADDSPTASYMRHDGIKGKNFPDSCKPPETKTKTTSEVRPTFSFPTSALLILPSQG